MENEATNIKTIIEAKNEAERYLKYVYVGNISGVDNNTYCPTCNELLVERNGYSTNVLINNNRCKKCEEKINIII